MAEKAEKKITFEDAMLQLEEIVEKLEQGDVPLEESIDLYQQGMKLSKVCHTKLKNVERKMDTIMHEDGKEEPLVIQEENH
ncbi:exodeoxyribonuclease VII small subunit [Fictibacillus phosphorivorans]|uniref:exodeoxyribonuclease VII small subunit n=1 Tax=Fictibacillus phosphorivorans TaxID=1221500 RepID=UPI00203FA19A|nr:exodeoxyribonuclease VII small subunit [Fictibacillus phosphorivorans]MCM3716750.1 exodeoxyribonuclease VII small subunit [Fictibacillus phosphorivorans]MCM3774701.1 exodeoxyribonuclease VII small subunit [Fictibacillus phosphorivorans]